MKSFKITVPFTKVYIVEGEDKQDALEQFKTDDYREPDYVIEKENETTIKVFGTPIPTYGW